MSADLAFMGAYFPPWLLASLAGGGLTVLFKLLFKSLGLSPHMKPRLLCDASLLALMIMLSWLTLFSA